MLKSAYYMTMVDGMFCLDARVINKLHEMLSVVMFELS